MDHGVTFEISDSSGGDVVTISQVRRQLSDPGPERFPHLHDWHELVIFDDVRGELETDLGHYNLSGQCAVWIPKMAVHDFLIEPGVCSWTLIQYSFLRREMSPDDHILASTLKPDDVDRLTHLTTWLKSSVVQGHMNETQQILDLMRSVISRSVPLENESKRSEHAFHKLKPALARLHEANGSTLSLAEAASLCSLSPSYFSRIFRAYVGMNFSDYSVQVRLKRSAISLASTRKPLKLISYENGFHQPAYFSVQFKKRYGMTPSQFRKTSVRS